MSNRAVFRALHHQKNSEAALAKPLSHATSSSSSMERLMFGTFLFSPPVPLFRRRAWTIPLLSSFTSGAARNVKLLPVTCLLFAVCLNSVPAQTGASPAQGVGSAAVNPSPAPPSLLDQKYFLGDFWGERSMLESEGFIFT